MPDKIKHRVLKESNKKKKKKTEQRINEIALGEKDLLPNTVFCKKEK